MNGNKWTGDKIEGKCEKEGTFSPHSKLVQTKDKYKCTKYIQIQLQVWIKSRESVKKRGNFSPLKIGADTQREEHRAQSDRMSDVFLLVRKYISLGQQMYFSLSEIVFLLACKLFH